MKFGTIPVQQAEGKIFAHNIAGTDGRNAFRKGKTITNKDIDRLTKMGYQSVYAAELETGDVDENGAARQIASAAVGGTDAVEGTNIAASTAASTSGLRLQGHSEGRVNLIAQYYGLLRVNEASLEQVNVYEGIAFATLRSFSLVRPGQRVATVKIIPYAISRSVLEDVLRTALEHPLIQVKALRPRRVGIIYIGSEMARERVLKTFGPALHRRVAALESTIETETYLCLTGQEDERALADMLRRQIEQGAEILLMASETSTMDLNDIIPCSVRALGGQITCVGAPIEPGNLVMLAYLGAVPLLNLPGCIRTPSPTLVDQILAALLAGERLSRADITRLGHGGLIEGGPHGT